MLKRILMVCLASLFLLVTFAVPVAAAVPEDVNSMVNFLDYTMLDGATATLYSKSQGDMSVDCVFSWDDLNKTLSVTWEVTFTVDDFDDYYLICDYTYQDVAPHLSAYAYANGAYYGSANADISYAFGFFGNTNFEDLSYSSMSYEELMLDNVVFIFLETSNLENLSYLEYPAIYQDYDGRLSNFDGVQWSSESYYFWTPYNESYFEVDNSDQAYQEGYQEGYEAGLNKFVDDLQSNVNVFSLATYTLVGDTEGTVVYNGPITPNISNNAISFDKAIRDIQDQYGYFEWVKITATWSDPDAWVFGSYSLGYSGYVDFDVIKIYDNAKGKEYYLDVEEDLNKPVKALTLTPDQSPEYPIFVNSMVIDGMESAFNQFAIVTGAKDYNNGYNAGFASGVLASNEDVYTNGFRDGREEGYVVGKAEGLELAAQGDWRNLFVSVVEAPLHVFNSLFNFEVLGLDMRDFMASMFTLCLVVLVFDKFLGGI